MFDFGIKGNLPTINISSSKYVLKFTGNTERFLYIFQIAVVKLPVFSKLKRQFFGGIVLNSAVRFKIFTINIFIATIYMIYDIEQTCDNVSCYLKSFHQLCVRI